MKTFLAALLSFSLLTPALALGGGYSQPEPEPEPEPEPPAVESPAPDPAPSAEPSDETRLVDQEGVATEDREDIVRFLKKGANTLVRVGTSPACLIEQILTFGDSAETCMILEVFDTSEE